MYGFPCECDGKVAGYAYGGPHRQRMAYRWSTEVSVYIHSDYRRKKIGHALYYALEEILKLQNYVMAYAGITLPNDRSRFFHLSQGYTSFAIYKNVGYKNNAWHDVEWLWKELNNPEVPPGEIVPYTQLEKQEIDNIFKQASTLIKQ